MMMQTLMIMKGRTLKFFVRLEYVDETCDHDANFDDLDWNCTYMNRTSCDRSLSSQLS